MLDFEHPVVPVAAPPGEKFGAVLDRVGPVAAVRWLELHIARNIYVLRERTNVREFCT